MLADLPNVPLILDFEAGVATPGCDSSTSVDTNRRDLNDRPSSYLKRPDGKQTLKCVCPFYP